jgi:hypothetical protein
LHFAGHQSWLMANEMYCRVALSEGYNFVKCHVITWFDAIDQICTV